MTRINDVWKDIDNDHKVFLIGSIVVPLIVWWAYIGRKTYSMKGRT
jgi:hypothetical protein